MNGRHAQVILAMVVCYLCFILGSCRTMPDIDTSKTDFIGIDIMQTQTEIAISGKDLASTIDNIKVITDETKISGEISKDKIVKVIECIDRSSIQVKTMNETIAKQTGQIASLEKSRISDNANASKVIADKQNEIDNTKIKASIFFRWALIASGIALVLAGILWLPKLLRLIL